MLISQFLKEDDNAMQAMINTVNRGRVPPSTESVVIASPSDAPVPLSLLDEAIALHQVWKETFMAAVGAGETLDVDAIRRDDCCTLGRWIHTEGRARYGAKPELVALLKHRHQWQGICRCRKNCRQAVPVCLRIHRGGGRDHEVENGGCGVVPMTSILPLTKKKPA